MRRIKRADRDEREPERRGNDERFAENAAGEFARAGAACARDQRLHAGVETVDQRHQKAEDDIGDAHAGDRRVAQLSDHRQRGDADGIGREKIGDQRNCELGGSQLFRRRCGGGVTHDENLAYRVNL
jgi:hypothetical protein